MLAEAVSDSQEAGPGIDGGAGERGKGNDIKMV